MTAVAIADRAPRNAAARTFTMNAADTDRPSRAPATMMPAPIAAIPKMTERALMSSAGAAIRVATTTASVATTTKKDAARR